MQVLIICHVLEHLCVVERRTNYECMYRYKDRLEIKFLTHACKTNVVYKMKGKSDPRCIHAGFQFTRELHYTSDLTRICVRADN